MIWHDILLDFHQKKLCIRQTFQEQKDEKLLIFEMSYVTFLTDPPRLCHT